MRWVSLPVLLSLSSLWLASCATSKASFVELNQDKLPTAQQYPDDAVVVIHDIVTIHYGPSSGGKASMVTVRQLAVQLLRDSAADSFAESYYPEWETIDKLSLRITRPGKGPEGLGSKEYFDVPARAGGGVLFTQDRVAGYRVPPLPAGSTIEWLVQTTNNHPDYHIVAEYMASGRRTLHTELMVTAEPGFSIEHRLMGDADPQIRVSDKSEDGRQRVQYVRDNLGPRRFRNGEPQAHLWWPRAVVRLGDYLEDGQAKHTPTTAEELSREQHALVAGKTTPTDDIRAIHKTVLADMPPPIRSDPSERARALYAWAQKSIQYCALYESAMGGWVPHDIDVIARERSGDCKDKAAILSSLLAADGTASRLAVVYSHDGYPRPMSFPSMIGNHNHMILVVDLPSGPVVADPTTRAVPFGSLPLGDQGAEVLPISSKGDALMITAVDPPERNQLEVSYDLVQVGAEASGTMRVRMSGAYASSARSALLELPPSWYGSYLQDVLDARGRTKLSDVHVEGIAYDGHDTPVVLTARVSATPIVRGLDSDHPLLNTSALRFDELGDPADEAGGPHVFASLATTTTTVRIRIADDLEALPMPTPTLTNGKWLHVEHTASQQQVDGHSVITTMHRVANQQRVVPPEDRAAVRAEAVAEHDSVPYIKLKHRVKP
jgi:hypothetical protein